MDAGRTIDWKIWAKISGRGWAAASDCRVFNSAKTKAVPHEAMHGA